MSRKSRFSLSATALTLLSGVALFIALFLLLSTAASTVSAVDREFPPRHEHPPAFDAQDNSEASIRAGAEKKLRESGRQVPAQEDGDEQVMDGEDRHVASDYAYARSQQQHVRRSTSACDIDPKSPACAQEMKTAAGADEQEQANLNKTTADTLTYGQIAARFEFLLNEWACTATGSPLFAVNGDRDVLNYIYRILSHAFLEQGQHYGSNIVLEYHTAQDNMRLAGDLDPPHCDLVKAGDDKFFNSILTAMLLHRDLMVKWLDDNQVESQTILTSYVPEMRSMVKKWSLGRLMNGFGKCIENATNEVQQVEMAEKCPVRNNEMLLALLPILKDENAPLDECQAAGQLSSIMDDKREGTIRRELSRMLDNCLEQGKLAEDPIEFGETLRTSGREKQARQLFELAVERGKLCNVWQRPEEHHRKDLTAAPAWTEESFPTAKKHMAELKKIFGDVEKTMNWSDVSVMHPSMKSGYWQRAWLWGNHRLNDKMAKVFSAKDIARIKEIVKDIESNNDAYDWGCNGSMIVEMWRMSGKDMQSDKILGSTNMVLHYLSPIRGDSRIVYQLGEDTAQMDPATVDDSLVIDDTFEYRFFFDDVKPVDEGRTLTGAQDPVSEVRKRDIVLMHLQLCHPELHEKALDPPSKFCANTEWDE